MGKAREKEHDEELSTFLIVFNALVRRLQPRNRAPIEDYWAVLRSVPMVAIQLSADNLAKGRGSRGFFPTTAEWYAAAKMIAPPVMEGARGLDELDGLAPNDPERDEISKRLSKVGQVALMKRHGFDWAPQ